MTATMEQLVGALALLGLALLVLFWQVGKRLFPEEERRPHGCCTLFPVPCSLGSWLLLIVSTVADRLSAAHAATDSESATLTWAMVGLLSRTGFVLLNSVAISLALLGCSVLLYRQQRPGWLLLVGVLLPSASLVVFGFIWLL